MDPKLCQKLFVCSFENCSAIFKRIDRLTIHSRIHTGERPFVCSHEDCIKSYSRASHLKRHEATHLDKTFKCEYEGCGLILRTESTLKKHVDYCHKHKKPKTYKCKYCDKEFNKHCWLRSHEYRHTKVLPFPCPEEGCGKAFLMPSRLKRHLKIHQGYKCDRASCEEVLATWSLFRKHIMLAHPQVFKCDVCNQVFSTSYNLRVHKSVHLATRTVYRCPKENCPRFYFVVNNLVCHIKNYHNKRPFKCSYDGCYRSFKEESHLKKHERFHNPNLPLPSRKKTTGKALPG